MTGWNGGCLDRLPRDIIKLSNSRIGQGPKGGLGEVDRRRIGTGRASIGHDDIDGLALPCNPDLFATVAGLGAEVTVGTVVEGSDEVVVRVDGATSASDAVLREPGGDSPGVKVGTPTSSRGRLGVISGGGRLGRAGGRAGNRRWVGSRRQVGGFGRG
jgi:hypothetical protein